MYFLNYLSFDSIIYNKFIIFSNQFIANQVQYNFKLFMNKESN